MLTMLNRIRPGGKGGEQCDIRKKTNILISSSFLLSGESYTGPRCCRDKIRHTEIMLRPSKYPDEAQYRYLVSCHVHSADGVQHVNPWIMSQ